MSSEEIEARGSRRSDRTLATAWCLKYTAGLGAPAKSCPPNHSRATGSLQNTCSAKPRRIRQDQKRELENVQVEEVKEEGVRLPAALRRVSGSSDVAQTFHPYCEERTQPPTSQ